MKPALALLSLPLFALSALAQTGQTGKPAPAATTPPVQATPAAVQPAEPPKPAQIPMPMITGTPKPLYALRYVDTVVGTGPLAEPRKYYTVQYTGWLTDGTMFDSSYSRGEAGKGDPITFPYGAHQVISGWDTGFEGMHVGGKRRLFIPYQLAYGESGRPPVIPAKSDLIFDIELLGMADTPPQPKPVTPPAADPAATTQPSTTKPQ